MRPDAGGDAATQGPAAPAAAPGPGPAPGRGGVVGAMARAAFAYAGLDALQLVLAFLLVPLYTRLLSVEEYAEVGVLAAAFSLLGVLAGFGLRQAVVRHYFDVREDAASLAGYVGSAAAGVLVYGGGVAAAAAALLWLAPGLLDLPWWPHVPLLAASGLLVAFQGPFLGLFRAEGRIGGYRAVTLGTFLLGALLSVALVAGLGLGTLGWLLGLVGGNLATAAALAAYSARRFGWHWSPPAIRAALAFGLPLVPHALFGAALATLDRLLLQPAVSAAALAAYVLAYQLSRPLSAVTSAVNLAWQPLAYGASGAAGGGLGRAVAPYAALVGALAIALAAAAPELVRLVAPAAYGRAALYLAPVAVAWFFQSLHFVTILPVMRARRAAWMPLLSGSALAVQLALLAALVPWLGVAGAAWATLASFAFLFVAGWLAARALEPVRYEWRRIVTAILLVLGALALVLAAHGLRPAASLGLRAATALLLPLAMLALGAVTPRDLRAARRLLAGGAA